MGLQCKKCQEEIIESYSHQPNVCKKCYIDRQTKSANRKRKYIYDYLLEHPCVMCGESRPVVLEFHHTIPGEKENSISQMSSYSINNIQKEIIKCQVLCCNCHRIVTAKENGRYSFLNLPEFN